MDISLTDPEDDENSGDYERRDGGDSGGDERRSSSGDYPRHGTDRDPRNEF